MSNDSEQMEAVISPAEELDEILGQDIALLCRREQALYDELAAPFGDSLVIFGAGNLGRKTLAGLRRKGVEPLAFADNNSSLWKTRIDGVRVLSPQDASRTFGERAALVVAVWSPGADRRFGRIKQQLAGLGCRVVVPFLALFWKHADVLLPHYRLDVPHKILEQAADIRAAFSLFRDELSQREFVAQVKWLMSMTGGADNLPAAARDRAKEEGHLFRLGAREVYVDCGAYDGDTIRDFLSRQRNAFDRIVAFEPDPGNYLKLRGEIDALSDHLRQRVQLHQAAVGRASGKARFAAEGNVSSAISAAGELEVDLMALDEVMQETLPTYIKMDVEGAEPEALEGARRSIERGMPVLAICVYHVQDHLWRIPLFLRALPTEYRFFLRRYVDEFGDIVCYAVPPNRLAA